MTDHHPAPDPDRASLPEPAHAPPAPPSTGLAGSVLRWFVEGVRTAVLMRPRWDGLHAGPGTVLALLVVTVAIGVGLQRLTFIGPVSFNPYALFSGWLSVVALVWLCYALHPREREHPVRSPGPAHLFAITVVQGCFFVALIQLLSVVTARLDPVALSSPLWWSLWGVALALMTVALAVVLARGTGRMVLAPIAAVLAIGANIAESFYSQEPLWVTTASEEAGPSREWLQLTQSLMERQPRLLIERLEALQPQTPGAVDLYALTFAPYAHEDVFARESAMVADVMEQRFGTVGRTLQLVNHLDTAYNWPWATPLNLARAIHHVARVMDRDEDILFIHLTSHGAADGELAAQFWPMTVEPVTPAQLKGWLDEAGIVNRVISVSACYSGSWVEPLADDHTLVMTAADADNTSYGCGRLSELTYFGRAVFDEQLRTQTLSFEQAHAAARPIIGQREHEAGKDDGYSNPQISVGDGIRRPLEALVWRLETDVTACTETSDRGTATHLC